VTRKHKTGIGLLAGAFVPYAAAVWHVSRFNWTPLDYPVRPHSGEIQTPEFTSEIAGTYILSGIPSVVESSWKLWSGPKSSRG
jgi:hypothetical protein